MARSVGAEAVLGAVRNGHGTPQEILTALDLDSTDTDLRRRRLHNIRNALDHLKKAAQVDLDAGRWSVRR